jgi:hypothetical protein
MQIMSRHYSKILATIVTNVLALILTSCGFTPVYKHSHIDQGIVPAIHISSIDSVAGAEFYHTLSHLIKNDESSRYTLNCSLAYTSSQLLISKTSDVAEAKSIQTVDYKLIDNISAQTIFSGKYNVDGYYNSIYSPYASSVEEKRSQENLARLAAKMMHTQLIIYFSKINKK